jgi:hypothetical protein
MDPDTILTFRWGDLEDSVYGELEGMDGSIVDGYLGALDIVERLAIDNARRDT